MSRPSSDVTVIANPVPSDQMGASPLRWRSSLSDRLVRDTIRFGTVGAAGFVVDIALFNLLRFPGSGPLEAHPITARALAVLVATLVTYLGNRHWTWGHRPKAPALRGLSIFVLLNGVATGIALATLGVSHYVLGFTSPLADNLASYALGLPLATLFRFWAYQRFVFKPRPR